MATKKNFCILRIQNLVLRVNLGWTKAERSRKQKVLLDLFIHQPKPPKACQTDQLQDTFCYDQLIKNIRSTIADKAYRLIEHLTADIHHIASKNLPKDVRLYTALVKYPKIPGLSGGIRFEYGDSLCPQ